MTDDRKAYLAYRDECHDERVVPVSFAKFLDRRRRKLIAERAAASKYAKIRKEVETS